MKVKRYSLYGNPWEEDLKDPLYILDAGFHHFQQHDKELGIDSTSYYIITDKNSDGSNSIVIGDYRIHFLDGAHIFDFPINDYKDVNSIIPFNKYCIVRTATKEVPECRLNTIFNLINKENFEWSGKDHIYATYTVEIFAPIKLTQKGLLGISVMFDSSITATPINQIEKTEIPFWQLWIDFNHSGVVDKIEPFEKYKGIYQRRITDILS